MLYVTFYTSGNVENITVGWPKETSVVEFSGSVFNTDQELADIVSALEGEKEAWNLTKSQRTNEDVFVQTQSSNGRLTEENWYAWYTSSVSNSGPTRKKIYNYSGVSLTSVTENFYNNSNEIIKSNTYTFFKEDNSYIQKRSQ